MKLISGHEVSDSLTMTINYGLCHDAFLFCLQYILNAYNYYPHSHHVFVYVASLFTEENHIRPTTERTGLLKPDLLDASTKDPLHTTSAGGIMAPTTSTVQPTTQVSELLPPAHTDRPVDDYLPRVPEVHIGVEDDDDEYEDDENVNGVVDKFCEQTIYKGITWPQTRIGKTVEKNCPEGFRGKVLSLCEQLYVLCVTVEICY